jgi:hypothetical protein
MKRTSSNQHTHNVGKYIYISLNRDIGQFCNVVSCKRNRMFMDAKWPHVHIHETGSCCMLSIYRLCTWKGMQTNQTLRLSKCSSCSVEWRTQFFLQISDSSITQYWNDIRPRKLQGYLMVCATNQFILTWVVMGLICHI